MKHLIKRAVDFITKDIWIGDFSQSKSLIGWLVNEAKVLLVTFRNYGRHQIAVRSAALTFYTLISLVPVLAVILGLSKGFGLQEKLLAMLNDPRYQVYGAVYKLLEQFADSYLENFRMGVLATVSIVTLLWAVVKVFSNVELAFNHVWEIRRGRSFYRKVSDYLALLFILPILLGLYRTGAQYLDELVVELSSKVEFLGYLYRGLQFVAPFIIAWLVLTLVYFVLPNTDVRFGSAARSAVVAAILFLGFQFFYFRFQVAVSNYNIIYGGFAAIPLFLIWVNVSWQIILFGSELSFAYQNLSKYTDQQQSKFMSYEYRLKLIVLIMNRIAVNFIKGKEPFTEDALARELDISSGRVSESLYELERAGLLYSVEQKAAKNRLYIPAKDVHTLTLFDLISTLERFGQNSDEVRNNRLRPIDRIFDAFRKEMDASPENILLKDL